MSCLWFWCCRVHEDEADTQRERKEEQSKKRKRGKKERSGRWKIQWKKERKNNMNKEETEESQTNQQPAKVEEEADVLDLPVGLVSGSLDSVSAETLENTAPPLQENLTGEMEETIKHLMKTLLDEVEANMEQLLREPVKSLLSAESEAVRDLTEVLLEDAEPHSTDPGEERKSIPDIRKTTQLENLTVFIHDEAEEEMKMMMMMADEAEAEAIEALMDIDLNETEKEPLEKHLDHLVSSSDDEAEAIRELLEVQLEEEVSESVQPLENETMMTTMMMVVDEAEAEATKELVSTHLEDTEQSESNNEPMDINLDDTEEKPLEKHLDHLVSSNDDEAKAVSELLDIQLEEEVSASVQPLAENETMMTTMMMVVDEAEAEATTELVSTHLEDTEESEATNEPMDINQDDTQEEHLEKHLDEMDIKKKEPPEEDAENKKRNIRRGTRGKGRRIGYERDNNPQDGDKNEIRVSAHRTGAEGLRGQCRNDQEERKTPPETPRPKTHPPQQRTMERHEDKREHPHWKREQRTQQGFSERRSSGQRDNRKNWGDERRQVFHPRRVQEQTERRSDRNDSRVSAQRGGAEGLRGQCRNDLEEKKTPPETLRPKTLPYQQRKTEEHGEPREHPHWKRGQRTQHVVVPRGSSGQKDNRRNWDDERRQVFRPRRDQEQTDRRSTAVTDSFTALRTGERERRTREDPRVESTPPRTERNGGRERRGGERRVRRPHWWQHDDR
ncbi:plectin-like isoform X3 [Colossoma macropomum]|uniref:plectin-like isoform X3 n=1 Tax=Colossoma macropomum TaxID=42526 RepID=UPI0018642D23|nr:plectin-like isoform X3 [Colossoma macropomum]